MASINWNIKPDGTQNLDSVIITKTNGTTIILNVEKLDKDGNIIQRGDCIKVPIVGSIEYHIGKVVRFRFGAGNSNGVHTYTHPRDIFWIRWRGTEWGNHQYETIPGDFNRIEKVNCPDGQQGGYYQKYLKYKAKYIQLRD